MKTKFSRIQSQKILEAIGSHVDKEIGKKDNAATEASIKSILQGGLLKLSRNQGQND